jgi:release factor glutamine methyltransferase
VKRGAAYLARHGVEGPEVNAERLMMTVLATDRAGMLARENLTATEAREYGRVLCRRCTGTPLQHITGEQGFRHLILRVRPGVFIPRPETESVVDVALRVMNGAEMPLVADVCTGSGAIALSIARERRGARVWGTDASAEALALAEENAGALGLAATFLLGDMLDPLPSELRGSLDLVVGNPPYVPRDREAALPVEVLADPEDALFGGPEVYEKLAAQAFEWLRPGGHLVVEIDDEAGRQVSGIVTRAGFADAAVHPDLAGRDRVVAARRP